MRSSFDMDFSNNIGNDNTPLSDEVLEVLESQFNKVKTLHSTDLEIIAAELGVRDSDVKLRFLRPVVNTYCSLMWYTNRLAAWRRSQGLSDCFGQL
ncbi:homeodomain-only protein-like [Aphis craccivora]|uniref:Homeodomain-only protein-like n=1 Tax=Aphis craccivora TaxID=307492 RepID=A0A6G0YY96_APHCR|nr:homeodomain-only protein-like [Aphis craccivora]